MNYLIDQFKITFVLSCLSKSYGKKSFLIKNDRSINSDFILGIENYRIIDSLANITYEKILADSISWTNMKCNGCSWEKDGNDLKYLVDEGVIGKRTLKFCLDYYKSEELDAISKNSIQKGKNRSKKIGQ